MKTFSYNLDYYQTGIGGFHRESCPFISSRFENLLERTAPRRILDFGCGDGFWGGFLAKQAERVDGVDSSPALARTERRSIYHGFTEADLGKPWTSAIKYDVVFSIEVIEHVANYRQFLSNAFDALEPGGTLFLTTTTYFWTIFIMLIVYRRQTNFASLSEFTRGLMGDEAERSAFVMRFWDYFTGHYHGFTKRQLQTSVSEAGYVEVNLGYLHIQPVVPVHYLDQPYSGPHAWLVRGAVPFIRVIGQSINWFCRATSIYAPNILVTARKPLR